MSQSDEECVNLTRFYKKRLQQKGKELVGYFRTGGRKSYLMEKYVMLYDREKVGELGNKS